jgi:hypothetical protein
VIARLGGVAVGHESAHELAGVGLAVEIQPHGTLASGMIVVFRT